MSTDRDRSKLDSNLSTPEMPKQDDFADEPQLNLPDRIRQPGDLEVLAKQTGSHSFEVTICTSDCPGLLSIVAGLFAASRINIVSGEATTIHRPSQETSQYAQVSYTRQRKLRRPRASAPIPSRIALDTFLVTSTNELDDDFWRQFRTDLADLIKLTISGHSDVARAQLIDRASDGLREMAVVNTPLSPPTIEIDNESTPVTVLRIHSADNAGFLFEFTNALAMLHVDIERTEIRTVNGEVRDTFWVTDNNRQRITDTDRLNEIRFAATLIKQFTQLLSSSPNPAQAIRQFSAMARHVIRHPDGLSYLRRIGSDEVLSVLAHLMSVSRFLWEDFLRMQHENLLPVLFDTHALDRARTRRELEEEIADDFKKLSDHPSRVAALNQFKDREMFRIDLRHITGRVAFEQFSAELSDLAEAAVSSALELARTKVLQERPGEVGQSRWCACALGKFGGREIGFASDIELLFVYAADDEGDPHEGSPGRFYEEMVSEFLRTLTARQQGIFEIDLRLRPYGKAGPLATSLAAFERYYSSAGDAVQFERLSLVKLRPVAGDSELGRRVVEARDRFVFSGAPIDYENLFHLRHRQATELVPAGVTNAKYNKGGLVDIEYFVQTRQIDAGATIPEVRVPNTIDAIHALEQAHVIEESLASRLHDGHSFLRRLIDALRVVRGHAKDLTIPQEDSQEFAYLSRRLHYESPPELNQDIQRTMKFAKSVWALRG